MNKTYFENKQICAGLLKKEYLDAVEHRNGKRINGTFLFNRQTNKWINEVAAELKDMRLAKLFIESQFAMLSSAWCKVTFKRNYPPVRTVFSGNCWYRYLSYIDEGVSQPA